MLNFFLAFLAIFYLLSSVFIIIHIYIDTVTLMLSVRPTSYSCGILLFFSYISSFYREHKFA